MINKLFFIFFNRGDKFLFFTVFKNSSKLPFLSTDLTPALLTVSNAGVRSVDKKGSFDEFLKTVKNKNLSPRLKKMKKSLLIKSPFQKKQVQSKTA